MNSENEKLNVLYVCRLFNGFETSIKSKFWSPTGAPTIYRMINALDQDNDINLELVLTSKGGQPDWSFGFFKKIKIKNLLSNVTILYSFGQRFGKVGLLFQELFHVIYVINKIIFNRYDYLYVDHANIILASAVSRIKFLPVILRLMGVYPAMKDILSHQSIKNKIFRWFYKSPFSLVICTQDGSGIEPWLKNALNENIKVYEFINGIDYRKPSHEELKSLCQKFSIPSDKTIVLYLGKLEKIKGIYEFIGGIDIANKNCNNNFHGVIVGYGDQYNNIKKIISTKSSITLIPRFNHDEIFNIHGLSDIYVSPNRLANLTNANLEAMASGSCIVIPKSQTLTSVDLVTDRLLSDKAVYRVEFPPTGNSIANALVNLYDSPELRSSLSHNVLIESKKFLTSWNERISKELGIIRSLLRK
jgi:glycosyltransferase involved in cell wall biosynthesis